MGLEHLLATLQKPEPLVLFFKDLRSSQDPLFVGAAKSNIGHLEGASGIVSIIKATLALEKGVIPPNTNYQYPNPEIPAEKWNIEVI